MYEFQWFISYAINTGFNKLEQCTNVNKNVSVMSAICVSLDEWISYVMCYVALCCVTWYMQSDWIQLWFSFSTAMKLKGFLFLAMKSVLKSCFIIYSNVMCTMRINNIELFIIHLLCYEYWDIKMIIGTDSICVIIFKIDIQNSNSFSIQIFNGFTLKSRNLQNVRLKLLCSICPFIWIFGIFFCLFKAMLCVCSP